MSARDLPATTTVGPDADGVITVTSYRFDDEGKILRTVRRLRQNKVREQLPSRVLARRKWAKFGQAVDDPIDITVRDIDEQFLNLQGKPSKDDEKQEEQVSTKESIVVCRSCGQSGHWTRNCPTPNKEMRPLGDDDGGLAELFGSKTPADSAESAAAPAASDKYVPRHLQRAAAAAASGDPDAAANLAPSTSIRISNLPEEVTEDLVHELARKYGPYQRVFVARDQDDPSRCRGFAYVHYMSESDAQAAQKGLHKRGMLNHILHVELTKPRDRQDADRMAVAAASANQPSARPRSVAPWRQ